MSYGILIPVVSAFFLLLADLPMMGRFSNPYRPLVNKFIRLTVFLFIVFMNILQKNQWRVTFSIGLATFHLARGSVDEAIKAADELMYHVKHNGKNPIRHAVLKT